MELISLHSNTSNVKHCLGAVIASRGQPPLSGCEGSLNPCSKMDSMPQGRCLEADTASSLRF